MSSENSDFDNMVRIVDVIMRDRAEQLVREKPDVPVDEARRLFWHAFERGEFYLIHGKDGERVGWQPTRTAVERIRQRRKHRRLVERWREMQASEVSRG